MRRLFPHPILFLGLVLIWMVLTRFSLGHLILGSAIACGASWVVSRLRPKRVEIRSYRAALKLVLIVTWDILVSNIAVARVILRGPADEKRNPGFILVRLRLRDRNALAALAIIVTATPGTAWIEHDPETGRLLLHILDLGEDEDWQKIIGGRYEKLLMEIFE